MLVIGKHRPTKAELADWLATVPGFLQGTTSVDDRPTVLYDYQRALMDSPARFKAVLKSRQTGLSFGFAGEGLAKAHLKHEHTAIFVSYNLDDATEKIRHADLLYESMPARWQKRRSTDNKTSLEFVDARGRRSRLLSLPCREPRGKGKADVYLDELPFMRNSRRIYTAAVPIISRGGGALTLGSTPLGKLDLFFEIVEGEPERYPHYRRWRVPWWACPEFCTNVPAALTGAPDCTTDERVARFGTPSLRQIRESLDLEGFQQEYECAFVDSAVSFIPWELIVAAAKDRDELPVASTVEELEAIEVAGPLYAGYDVGRRRDASELVVVELAGAGRFRVRLVQTLRQAPFDVQRATLVQLLAQRADVVFLAIDATGLGMDLAEGLAAAHPGRAEGVTFTAPVKQVLGNTTKIAFERRNVHIPAQRDFMHQIHSVKKVVTAAGNVVLDADHADKHHADKFWALALALTAGSVPAQPAEGIVVHDERVRISPV